MTDTFLANKYVKTYFAIINQAKEKTNTIGENHHILPRSLGGSDAPDNMVLLSYRQHFICHMLLTKMCKHKAHHFKMISSFKAMTMQHSEFFNSRSYEYLKSLLSSMWGDEIYRANHIKLSATRWDDKKKAEFSKQMLSIWQNADYQAIIKASRLAMWQDLEFKEKMSKKHLEIWERSEHRKFMTSIRKKLWQDPTYRENQYEGRCKSWTPERKSAHAAKVSAAFAKRRELGLKSKPVAANQPEAWTEERREQARQRALKKLAV